MDSIKLPVSSHWKTDMPAENNKTLWGKFIAFADAQAGSRTMWFLLSLIVQGVFFLPVPAILMFYFNAPIVVLLVTLTMFFANVILGMGGATIRTLILCFALSVILHLAMLAVFIL